MREFCRAFDCDGLIEFPDDHPIEGDIGVCQKCGLNHVVHVEVHVVPIEEDSDG